MPALSNGCCQLPWVTPDHSKSLIHKKPPKFLHFALPFVFSLMGEHRDFKFCGEVDHSKSHPMNDKWSERGMVTSCDQFKIYSPNKVSLEWLKLNDFKFYTWLPIWSISLRMTNCPSNGHDLGHIVNYKFWGPQSYLWNDWNDSCQSLYTCRSY